jgi:hypothetical protein
MCFIYPVILINYQKFCSTYNEMKLIALWDVKSVLFASELIRTPYFTQ